ncbi:hypothetical protein SteCoe_4868 [Stentor coeruleus]|uniref:KATNIP domain-containing protein n=1 Tax=Stentor coeruleus TaxID=5963 RepID=A0A1R2CTT6_9CILI|nr:hypothetical protein SteCoe_4868 [Stentor coeruleus]
MKSLHRTKASLRLRPEVDLMDTYSYATYDPLKYKSSEDLQDSMSKKLTLQAKWNSPIIMPPTIPVFNQLDIQRVSQMSVSKKQLVSSFSKSDENQGIKAMDIAKRGDSCDDKGNTNTYRGNKEEDKLRKDKYNFFELILVTNWGDSDSIGLGQLEFFNENSELIGINKGYVDVRNSVKCFNPNRLVNGKKHSLEDKELWVSKFPSPMKYIRIYVIIPKRIKVCGMKIWNYPKSGLESLKGTKRAEVRLNGEKVWRGNLSRGDTSTEIVFLAGFKINDLDLKIQKFVENSVRIVNAPPGNPISNFRGLRRYSKSEIKLVNYSKTLSPGISHKSLIPKSYLEKQKEAKRFFFTFSHTLCK